MAGTTRGEATIEVAASPDRLYKLVSDITRMGEWSPECCRCEWLDGATEATVGARFEGHNRSGPLRWTTTPTVRRADPGREFAFTVTIDGRDVTHWRYRLEPSGAGTRVTESYEFVWAPLHLRIADVLLQRDRQLRAGMRKTLERLKTVAETGD